MNPARNSYEYTTYLFEAERDFNPVALLEWMTQNWWQSILYSAVYVAVVFGGKWTMKERKPFDLNGPLIGWNLLLSMFSFLGMVRSAPSFLYSVTEGGIVHSVCRSDFSWGVSGFWAAAFTLSKPFELVDTVFLVLRKRPIIFLHWYHHVTVMICGFLSMKDMLAAARWYLMMNYTVHTFMYGYYGLRAMGVWFPKFVPMGITIMQISQMVVGFAVTVLAFWIKQVDGTCDLSNPTIIYALGMYASYFYLFASLFYKAYFVTKKYDKKERKVTESQVPNILENGVREMSNGDMPKGDQANGHPGNVDLAKGIGSADDIRASSGVGDPRPRLRRKEA